MRKWRTHSINAQRKSKDTEGTGPLSVRIWSTEPVVRDHTLLC